MSSVPNPEDYVEGMFFSAAPLPELPGDYPLIYLSASREGLKPPKAEMILSAFGVAGGEDGWYLRLDLPENIHTAPFDPTELFTAPRSADITVNADTPRAVTFGDNEHVYRAAHLISTFPLTNAFSEWMEKAEMCPRQMVSVMAALVDAQVAAKAVGAERAVTLHLTGSSFNRYNLLFSSVVWLNHLQYNMRVARIQRAHLN